MKNFLFLTLTALLFFASCKKDTTPNGYEFVKHTNASGPKAKPGEYSYVHIDILADDTLLNSTREMERPLAINVIDFSKLKKEEMGKDKSNPIADVVGLLAVGDSVSVFVPITEEMRAAPQLQNVKKLVYNVVVVDIKNEEQYQQALVEERQAIDAQIAASQIRESEIAALVTDVLKKYKSGALKEQLKDGENGLKYLIVEEGKGEAAKSGKPVKVDYYGTLTNGTMFDNSFQRGTPINFTLGAGEVIPGWDQGIARLKAGDKAVLFIPSDLGYGPSGNGAVIPPNSELVFYIELVKVGM